MIRSLFSLCAISAICFHGDFGTSLKDGKADHRNCVTAPAHDHRNYHWRDVVFNFVLEFYLALFPPSGGIPRWMW